MTNSVDMISLHVLVEYPPFLLFRCRWHDFFILPRAFPSVRILSHRRRINTAGMQNYTSPPASLSRDLYLISKNTPAEPKRH